MCVCIYMIDICVCGFICLSIDLFMCVTRPETTNQYELVGFSIFRLAPASNARKGFCTMYSSQVI